MPSRRVSFPLLTAATLAAALLVPVTHAADAERGKILRGPGDFPVPPRMVFENPTPPRMETRVEVLQTIQFDELQPISKHGLSELKSSDGSTWKFYRPEGEALYTIVQATQPNLTFTAPTTVTPPATTPAAVPAIPPATPPTLIAPPTTPSISAPPATPSTPVTPAPAAAELPPFTQPFVASITTDRVYVRSGPGTAYYELGQLAKGDLVYVVGSSKGWYQILPPNGTFCLIAKEFVETAGGGGANPTSGTVKADYVNVRAGTAINPSRDPFAVLSVVRKGTNLKILGSTDKYYQIAPPERAFVYINPQFISKAATDYKIPDLKLPAGAAAPAQVTVTTTTPPAPTSPGNPTIELTTPTTPTTPTTGTPTTPTTTLIPPETGTASNQTHTPVTPVPTPQPAVQFSQTATQKFNELNARFQEEDRKPIQQRQVDDLLKSYKDLLTSENLSPSVKLGSESRIAALEKIAAIQRLEKDNTSATDNLTQQREALQQQYAAAEKAIAEYQASSPYIAQGTLQTSTIVHGKYSLINPATGRVVAYVDPQSDIDISALIGKYIAVRGTTSKPAGTDITLIKVSNATLMPAPAGAPAPKKE